MLTELSQSLADAVAHIEPSLLSHRGRRFHTTLFAVDEQHAIGSAHALRRLHEVFLGGHKVDATLVARSPDLDLGLVRIGSGTPLTPVTFAEVPRVGELVVPVAAGPRATLGMVSEVGGPWTTARGQEISAWIEVDGALPPGFMGGPLLAADGRVIGMNTRRLARGGTTIPAATLREAIDTLLQRGSTDPGFLGIGGATATLTADQAAAAGQTEALLVVAVEPDSPADGTLIVGDIVLDVGGTAVAGIASLRRELDGHGPGSEVSLRVLGPDGPVERTVTLGSRPAGCR